MDKITIKKNLIKEALQEIERLNTQFDEGEISIANIKEVQEIIWKIYYNIWQNNNQYNSAITFEELKKIHEDYNQEVLGQQKAKTSLTK